MCDNEKGLLAGRTKAYFSENGITHVLDPPYTPQFRGIVERKIARIKTLTTLLLHQANFRTRELKSYWPFAAKCAARIINNTIEQRGARTPNELYGSKVEKLWKLPIFGSVVEVLKGNMNDGTKTTFGERTNEYVFLDFCDRGRGEDDRRVIKFLNPTTMEVGSSQSFKISNGEYLDWPFHHKEEDNDELSVSSTDSDYGDPNEEDNEASDESCSDSHSEGNVESDSEDEEEITYLKKPRDSLVERACALNMSNPLASNFDVFGETGKLSIKILTSYMCNHLHVTTNKSKDATKSAAHVDGEETASKRSCMPSGLRTDHTLHGLAAPLVGGYNPHVDGVFVPKRVSFIGSDIPVDVEETASKRSCMPSGLRTEHTLHGLAAPLVGGSNPHVDGVDTVRKIPKRVSFIGSDIPVDVNETDSKRSCELKEQHTSSVSHGLPAPHVVVEGSNIPVIKTGNKRARGTLNSDRTPKEGLQRCTSKVGLGPSDGLDLSGRAWIKLEDKVNHRVYHCREDFTHIKSYLMQTEYRMPTTLGEINKHPDSELIWESIKKELKSLIDNETWELVRRPKERKVIKSKWILTVKLDVNGDIERYKARFVARGFTQILGLDYNETYAPVVSTVSLRIVLAMMAAKGWDMTQLDVETAFLNSDIDEEIYVEQAEGYDDINYPRKDWVLRMLKALYGLKQSPHLWNKLITEVLTADTLGLIQNTSLDECLFVARNKEGKVAIVCLYVDDLVITGDWTEKVAEIKETLNNKFKMRDVSKKGLLLGMAYEYNQEKKEIKIHQAPFVKKIVERFRDEFKGGLKPHDTPAITSTYQDVFKAMSSKKDIKVNFPYREAIGCLLYLVVMTRPDLANIVRFLSRFVTCFTSTHVNALARVFGYVMHTPLMGLKYSSHAPNTGKLEAYSDASFNDDPGTARSTNAAIVMLNGSAVAWKSTMMNFVVMSSTHSEFGAMSETVFSALHCRNILNFVMGNTKIEVVTLNSKEKNAVEDLESACIDENGIRLNVDNLAAIHIATHELHSKRSKHINLRFMNVRDSVLRNEINIKWVSTKNQYADLLTKCLAVMPFRTLRDAVMSNCI